MEQKEKNARESRRERAAGNLIFRRLAMLVLLAGVLTYIGVYVYQAVYDPFKTGSVISYTATEDYTVNGFVVRNEEPLRADYAYVSVAVAEGSKVGRNHRVAMAYNSQSAYELGHELTLLQNQLGQLQHTMEHESAGTSAAALDENIYSGLTRLTVMLAAGDVSALPEVSSALKSALLRRDYLSDGIAGMEEKITEVSGRIDALKSQLTDTALEITAPYSGIYSSYTDGLERVLTPHKVYDMSPEQLRSAATGSFGPEDGAIGKIVSGNKWYYAFVADARQSAVLEARSTVKVRFDREDEPYTMSVERVGLPDDKGQRVVLLSCASGFANMLQQRSAAAQIILGSHTGLRIPKEALHLNENGETGVYCISGVQATFKKVDITWVMDEYYLVKEETTPYSLKRGEEIIISAKSLYEGKIVR